MARLNQSAGKTSEQMARRRKARKEAREIIRRVVSLPHRGGGPDISITVECTKRNAGVLSHLLATAGILQIETANQYADRECS